MEDNNFQNEPKELMRLAKDGDAEAFSRLYELYFAPIFRYIYMRTKIKDEAEDLTQEVFLKVFKSISAFQEKNQSPLAYFFTIARNIVIDHWRKKKEILIDEEIANKIPDDKRSPQDLIEQNETAVAIRQAIGNLTEEQQDVIIMKFINDLSNREIAKLLGKSEEAIRQLQYRALKTLREYLKNSKII